MLALQICAAVPGPTEYILICVPDCKGRLNVSPNITVTRFYDFKCLETKENNHYFISLLYVKLLKTSLKYPDVTGHSIQMLIDKIGPAPSYLKSAQLH